MNVFSVGTEKEYKLTRENFLNVTHKKFPFFQDVQKYKNPYFAICPACNNPIQIINLFGEQYKEIITGKRNMHGRHYKGNVEGLADYNEANYNSCPLHKPIAFGIVGIREDEGFNEEIRLLVEKNRRKISLFIREIIGIYLTNQKIDKIITDYIVAKGYCYTHKNKYNIPYSILYVSKSISIFGQKNDLSGIGMRIADSINKKSLFFEVKEGRIEKTVDDFVSIDLLVLNHIVRSNKQYLTIRILESHNDETHCVFEEKIEMTEYFYV